MRSYRGYGLSEGKPSEAGLRQDADASLAYLLQRPDINHKQASTASLHDMHISTKAHKSHQEWPKRVCHAAAYVAHDSASSRLCRLPALLAILIAGWRYPSPLLHKICLRTD